MNIIPFIFPKKAPNKTQQNLHGSTKISLEYYIMIGIYTILISPANSHLLKELT